MPISPIRKLLGWARVTVDKNKITPAVVKKGDDYDVDIKPLDLPGEFQDVYKYIADSWNTGLYNTNLYRFERYKDLKYACTVSPILSTAVRIYKTEIFSPEPTDKPVGIISSEKKVEKVFYEWCEQVGINEEFVRSAIEDIITYGDGFWSNRYTKDLAKGIVKLTRMNPLSIKSRMEWAPSICDYDKKWQQTILNLSSNHSALKDIVDEINGKEKDTTLDALFDQYCLGYEISVGENSDTYGVAPWKITHCRLYTTDPDFFPFGKSVMFNCLPAWKSLMTAMQLQDMLRCAVFPREKITIKGGEGMTPATRQKRVDEVRKYLLNVTKESKGDGNLSTVGKKIFAIEDLFDVELIDNSIDLDKIADIEMKRKDLVMATGIPDSYIIPSEGAGELGGDHAESLKYLSKMFQKRCNEISEAFLRGISETFRIHLMLTKQFDGINTEFELSLPVTSEDESQDHLDKIQAMFDFTKDIFSNLNDIAVDASGSELPSGMVAELLKKYLPELPNVNQWVTALMKAKAEQEEKEQEDERMQKQLVKLQNELKMQKELNKTLQGFQANQKQKAEEEKELDDAEKEREEREKEREDRQKDRDAERDEIEKKKEKQKQQESIKHTFEEALKKDPNLLNKMYMKARKNGTMSGVVFGRYTYNDSYKISENVKGTGLGILQEQVRQDSYDSSETSVLED